MSDIAGKRPESGLFHGVRSTYAEVGLVHDERLDGKCGDVGACCDPRDLTAT